MRVELERGDSVLRDGDIVRNRDSGYNRNGIVLKGKENVWNSNSTYQPKGRGVILR